MKSDSTKHHLRLIAPPATLPVTLGEAKAYLRVDHGDEDEMIGSLISAAVEALDGRRGFLGRALEAQTWELVLDTFPAKEIRLPLGPVSSVVSVNYTGLVGIEQTVAAEHYEIDTVPTFEGWVVPHEAVPWPATMSTINAVRVRFVAGIGTPEPVKQAILAMVAVRYDGRDGGRMLTPGVVNDLAPYRRPVVT